MTPEAISLGRLQGARLRTLVATVVGLLASAGFILVTKIDTWLVSGYRGDRTVPFRLAFLVPLAAVLAWWARRASTQRAQPGFARTALSGAFAGYASGVLAHLFVAFVLVSPEGAWRSISSGFTGALVPLGVPLVTGSWFVGGLAFIAAGAVLGSRRLRDSATSQK